MERDTILFFQSSLRHWVQRLRGIFRGAERFGWRVHVIDASQPITNLQRLFEFWFPVGCIVEGGLYPHLISPKDMRFVPTVFCDVSPSIFEGQKGLFVKHDSRATATEAFRELQKLGWKNYAFVGYYSNLYWSKEREQAFGACVQASGSAFHLFNPPDCVSGTTALEFHKRLYRWLDALPKPCALLAANDSMAEAVLIACHSMNIDVPEEIAVIGIDNDELICEMVKPTLTSVQPDFEKAGYMSIELLAGKIDNPKLEKACLEFGPLQVVRRGSTGVLAVRNKTVASALELIRRESIHGLKAIDVINSMGCGRRKAEIAFHKATGSSILAKIDAARMDAAFAYLRDPRMRISAIADFCGYESSSNLRKRFRAVTGKSMRQWRLDYLETKFCDA